MDAPPYGRAVSDAPPQSGLSPLAVFRHYCSRHLICIVPFTRRGSSHPRALPRFICIANHLFVRQDSRIRVAPLTACSALRAIPSLRSVLTAFGGYVLITSRFVCDSCSFHHDSSARLILAYQTLIDPLIQRLLAFASSSIILCILCHALCLITIKRRILLAYGSGRLDPSISNA